MSVAFGVLGPLTVHDGVEPRPITSPTHRLLLTRLLLDPNRPVGVDALLAVVWGERPPRTAVASLHNHVARLRRGLGPRLEDRLTSTGSGYQLRVGEDELDSSVFAGRLQRARSAHGGQDWPTVAAETVAALALWRGGPPADSAAVDPAEAARLSELRLQALEWRFDAELALGRHHGLAAELTGLTAEFPLRESFHRQLMLALWHGDRRADALAVYRTLRTALVEELGLEPDAAVQRTHREILAGGPRPAPTRPQEPAAALPPAPPALPTAPSQLPLAPADFTGRQSELDALALYLRPGEPGDPARVVIVTGMGGVGKTALVLHGAHAVREDFPDGQLYADLRGFGLSEARTPHDLLGRFLTDLGVPGRTVPADTDDRAALYRSLLAERQVLVVLDNARDGRQLVPLLPGTGRSAVVVTSRHKLAGVQCSTRIPLGPLSAPEQRALLTSICGAERVEAEPVAAGQVMAACAGLPLALRIAGSRLAHRPAWRLSELARRLGTSSRLQALAVDHLAVREAFSFSYASLLAGDRPQEREAARAFRLLGLWPSHPHSAESVAALLGTAVDEALDVLDTLVDAHLLDVAAPGRYRFHDLLGEFAAERVHAEEAEPQRDEALQRLLGWYTSAVSAANSVITPLALQIPAVDATGPDWELFETPEHADEDAALEWCGQELAAIRTAVRRAGELGRPDLAWRMASALFGYGLTYWWNGEWTECLYEALALARAADDLRGQAWLHGRLGVAYGLARQVEPCIEHVQQAYEFFVAVGDLAAQRVAMTNLASALNQAGETERAGEWAARAAELEQQLADRPDAARLASLGDLNFRKGDFAAAELAYREAIAGWRELDSRSQLSLALYNLGDTLRVQGRTDEAVDALLEALAIRRDLGSRGNVADTLETLARTHFERGDHHAARRYWSEALELARQHGLTHFARLSEEGLAQVAS
ncbi:BTAD domain-containing putative transcriptional regulator [Streptomyces sp. TLI_171]|uniref:AfsR/SARP family transcriptional regulator n=1 Tax=Streptomyces sp. TLI_171 TaxID=1938859 RepID=UPI000C18812D|nr:BTAD domain-containing putative transcriptional regulator [Streptomyces sp. TLI_171]RKE17320.1 DNA-binding SARP family transcriptional activator [Streptomyces sp. TLI_171]